MFSPSALGKNCLFLLAITSYFSCSIPITEDSKSSDANYKGKYSKQVDETNLYIDKYNEMLKANQETSSLLWTTEVYVAEINFKLNATFTAAKKLQDKLLTAPSSSFCKAYAQKTLTQSLDQAISDTISAVANLEQQIKGTNLDRLKKNALLNFKVDSKQTMVTYYEEETKRALSQMNGFRESALLIGYDINNKISLACKADSKFDVQNYKPISDKPQVNNTPGDSSGYGSFNGVVFAPNGSDPVVSALIYVPSKGNEGIKLKNAAFSNQSILPCGEPDEGYLVKTCSDGSGRFEIKGLSQGSVSIRVKKGKFSKNIDVSIKSDESVSLPAADSTLPIEDSAFGKVAKITVVNGSYDHLSKVLDKIGLNPKGQGRQYDVITSDQFISLLAEPKELAKIDLLMINCGNDSEASILKDEKLKANLKQFVENGGALFATDQAYDFVEQIFADAVTFVGDGGFFTSTVMNKAQIGVGGEVYEAQLNSVPLSTWLKKGVACGNTAMASTSRPCLNDDSTVRIEGFMGGWAQIEKAEAMTTVWVESPERALTVSFSRGKGKVFYSSYHTYHEKLGSEEIFPQERILQYFVFDVMD